MRKQRYLIPCLAGILLILLVLGLFCQKQRQGETSVSKTSFLLNTVVTITLYDCQQKELLEEAMELCRCYEHIFSRTLSTSELWKLNHGDLPQKNGFWQISSEMAELISRGLLYAQLSDGAFDITIEPVSSLWNFSSGEHLVSEADQLQAALPLVDYQKVTLSGQLLAFDQEGMGLDLGAIAKGYIADRIKEFLQSRGVKSAVINLGGNILCIGQHPEGTPFSVGVQKPFSQRSDTVLILGISDQSVVSSGIYERYFEQNGILYHHLLNPDTGYPWDNSLLSVTIISDSSVDGDGLSTACFALGLEKGMELINSLPDIQAIFITEDMKIYYSQNFQEHIPILSQTTSSYDGSS